MSKSSQLSATCLLVLVCSLTSFGCGRFYLSQEVSRSPAVASASDGFRSGFGPPPSTATVWVEQVSPDSVAVVGKVFDGFSSDLAAAAPVSVLSGPVPVAGGDELVDPTSAIAGVAVVQIDGGFFVVWMQPNGPMTALFTDLTLSPMGPPFSIVDDVGGTNRTQGRSKLWAFSVRGFDRIVVFWPQGANISYAIIDTGFSRGEVLGGIQSIPDAPFADVSYAPDSFRNAPFMLTYLRPDGGLEDPFTVYAQILSFNGAIATTLLPTCVTDVSDRKTANFQNTAGAAHPNGNRFVVYDERNGDLFGRFLTENCSRGPEIPLGTRITINNLGNLRSRSFWPLDVEFASDGTGLVALKQGIPNASVIGGLSYVVSVVPLRFDGLRITPGPLKPVGVAVRGGAPYENRSFQVSWDLVDDVFKLVFDEVAEDERSLAIPATWRVLFNALDANGSTVDPSTTTSGAAAESTFAAKSQSQDLAVESVRPRRLPQKTLWGVTRKLDRDRISELRERFRSLVPELDFEALLRDEAE